MILKLHNLKNEFPNFNIDELKNAHNHLQNSLDRSLIKILRILSVIIILSQSMFILHLDNLLLKPYLLQLFKPRLFLVIISIFLLLLSFNPKLKLRGLYQILIHHILSNICLLVILSITFNNQKVITSWIITLVLVMGLLPIPIRHSIFIYIQLIPIYIAINLIIHNHIHINNVLGIVRPMFIFGIPALLFKNYFLKTLELLILKKTLPEKINSSDRVSVLNPDKIDIDLNICNQLKNIKCGSKDLIYIVDEDKVNLSIYKDDLSDLFSTVLFKDYREFSKRFISLTKPDLLILGDSLNFTSASLICKEIRKIYDSNELPIILVSKAENREIQFSLNIINDYITTPIIREELLFRIDKLIKLKNDYLISRDSQNLISLIESIITMTHDIKTFDTEELLKEYVETLYSFIKDFDGDEHKKYKERLHVLSNNLHPFIEKNPYVAKLVTMLSGFRPDKESFSSFIKRYKISKHQAEIIKLMFEGEATHGGLADKLGKTKSNISSTLNRIYNKVGVSNQSELMLNIENIYFEEQS